MSVNSTKVGSETYDALAFPKLMKGATSGATVFFHKEKRGMVVTASKGEYGYDLGFYSTTWNMFHFKDLPVGDGVTLTNVQP